MTTCPSPPHPPRQTPPRPTTPPPHPTAPHRLRAPGLEERCPGGPRVPRLRASRAHLGGPSNSPHESSHGGPQNTLRRARAIPRSHLTRRWSGSRQKVNRGHSFSKWVCHSLRVSLWVGFKGKPNAKPSFFGGPLEEEAHWTLTPLQPVAPCDDSVHKHGKCTRERTCREISSPRNCKTRWIS